MELEKINKGLFGNLDSDAKTRYNIAISVLQHNQTSIPQEKNLQIEL